MDERYHAGQRAWQDRFDTRRLADRLAEGNRDRITDDHRRFIEARDMFFLATTDAHGMPQCSYKGGLPGFVRVVDERTIAFPVYDGNGRFLSVGNLSVNPNVAILFVDFEQGTRLRFNGVASIEDDDPLIDRYPGALLVVRVHAEAVFANCRRYVHHYELVERSPFVPTGDAEPPVPDWKRDPGLANALPEHDPARDPDRPSGPAVPRF